MTQQTSQTNTDATIAVGVTVLSTTVSAVVWWFITMWVWESLAQRDWWGDPEGGAKIVAAGIALFVTWIIWGRVAYWQSMPDSTGTGVTSRTAEKPLDSNMAHEGE